MFLGSANRASISRRGRFGRAGRRGRGGGAACAGGGSSRIVPAARAVVFVPSRKQGLVRSRSTRGTETAGGLERGQKGGFTETRGPGRLGAGRAAILGLLEDGATDGALRESIGRGGWNQRSVGGD